MTDPIPTNATPTTAADFGAVTMHPTVMFFNVLSFELQRLTALGEGAGFLCWRSKDGCIAWARLDLFATARSSSPPRSRRCSRRAVR